MLFGCSYSSDGSEAEKDVSKDFDDNANGDLEYTDLEVGGITSYDIENILQNYEIGDTDKSFIIYNKQGELSSLDISEGLIDMVIDMDFTQNVTVRNGFETKENWVLKTFYLMSAELLNYDWVELNVEFVDVGTISKKYSDHYKKSEGEYGKIFKDIDFN